MKTMIHSWQQMEQLTLKWGFLPFFHNTIEGFSIEELTPETLWFSKEHPGPWEWKGPVIREWRCAYGKFFAGKACFVSLEWLPDFANWRRYRYPMDAMGEDAKHVYDVLVEHESLLSKELKLASGYTLSRKRTQDGSLKDGPACDKIISQLEMAIYVCIADFEYLISKGGQQYGWGVARYCTPEAMYGAGLLRCERSPEESRERIINHVHSLFPTATRAQIEKLI